MKACKIDIVQKWVDIEHPIYREVVRDQFMTQFRETGRAPDMVTLQEKTYLPMKVYEPGMGGEVTTYLVQREERGIFKKLMTIQETTLNEAVENAVNEKWEMKHYGIEAEERKRIRELPWYKRLFNKF